jgi:polysaccharide biosynthesis protein PslH
VRRLARVADVTIAALDDGTADREELHRLGIRVITTPWRPTFLRILEGVVRTKGLTSARFWDRRLAAAIRAEAAMRPPDVVVLEYVQLEALVRRVRARHRILATHNVESTLMRTLASVTPPSRRFAMLLDALALRRMERRVISRYDTTVVVSETDLAGLPVAPRAAIVCPNGQEEAPPVAFTSEPRVVFIAQLGWGPNVDASLWLGRSIWPEVHRQRPDAELTLVGRNPTDEVRALDGGHGVTVAGTVDTVRPFLEQALLAVAPLRAGSGTRLKILEALAHCRPVVATSLGVEGLDDLVGCGVVVADDVEGFASHIVALLDDPALAHELGQAGRRAVMDRYSWDRSFAPLLGFVASGELDAKPR